ncbi:MAG: glycosyltransferase family 25 protein [Rickettsiales bacterium]|jgi:glycosyl transferase family 25|nr:glycosyltransferase family 25 protein [Rickettsiales bacterium]
MSDDLEILVINLDRSPERMREMEARLRRLGLRYTRVPAVDGRQASFTKREVDAWKYSLAHGKLITPSEVACYISHYSAIRAFAENPRKKFALILEDDMEFDGDFADVVAALLKNHSWDMVKLNGNHAGGNVSVARITSGRRLVANAFHQSKAGAYLINKKAARSYARKMLPMFVPLDHELVKYWKYGIRGYSVHPFPSRETGAPSTIDYAQVRRNRKPWYRKGPTLAYKSYIALRRALHLLFGGDLLRAFKNKFGSPKSK